MKLIAGPFDKVRLGDFLAAGLKSNATRFDAAFAFARMSGVVYILGLLAKFSKTRCSRIIVGVDLLGTSVDALEALLKISGKNSEIVVFHNRAATYGCSPCVR